MTEVVLAVRSLGELESVIERGQQTFVEVGQALLEIRERRLYHEQEYGTFEAYCQERWNWGRNYVNKQIQAAEVVGVLGTTVPTPATERQARELVPLMRQDERAVVEVWRELKETYGDDVTAQRVKRVVTNRMNRIQRERDAQARATSATGDEGVGEISLWLGDMRERGREITDTSVDLILTDPPYPQEFLSLWSDLSEFASRVLKQTGILIAYTGAMYLPEVIQRLGEHLRFWWAGSVVFQGAHSSVHARGIHQGSKPILFYVRSDFNTPQWIEDTYRSEGVQKETHEWQQSIGLALYYIGKLTTSDGLVVDPFVGGGTTALAAKNLGRRCIGIDNDPMALAAAGQRLLDGQS